MRYRRRKGKHVLEVLLYIYSYVSRWLYALFIAMDANFRLRRKDISSDTRDPGLNQGYAYIICEAEFKAYLERFTKKISPEKSDCSNHDAIKSANIRGGRGVAASGLGAVTCSRHDMRRPVSAGDLQKGERCARLSPPTVSYL
jgi:hypothetical protein